MSSISSARSLRGHNDLASQLLSEYDISPNLIDSFQKYEMIYRVRHDLIHALICDTRVFPFGERSLETIRAEEKIVLTDMTYYDQVKDQTPDIMEFSMRTVKMIEITVSTTPNAFVRKAGKYALLNYFLSRNGYKVDYEIIVINPKAVYSMRDVLIQEHKLNDLVIGKIGDICKRSMDLLAIVHNTDQGRIWHKQFTHSIDSQETINYTIEDVLDEQDSNENKCFMREDDLKDLLNSRQNPELDASDNEFLMAMATMISQNKCSLEIREDFIEENFWPKFDKYKQFSEPKAIMPLPYFEIKDFDITNDASHRGTHDDLSSCYGMASMMSGCGDAIHAAIGKSILKSYMIQSSKEKGGSFLYGKPRFEADERRAIAIEGPGRKAFIKKDDEDCKTAQYNKREFHLDVRTNTDFVRQASHWLCSDKKFLNKTTFDDNCSALTNLNCRGLRYVLICQSIFRELNINALRKERKHGYLLKNTGIPGVFILIYPGLRLKAGETPSPIWYKVLIDSSKYEPTSPPFSNVFRKIFSYGNHYTTEWLSTDAHRLDHYLRCYDKILMAYFAVMQSRYRTDESNPLKTQPHSTILDCVNNDTSNVLGLIILTYMEDKRSTSKTLQHARYLLMTSTSIFPYYNSVMDKVVEPVRSSLQLFYIQCMVRFIRKMRDFSLTDHIDFGKINYDPINKVMDDKHGGAIVKLPRLFINDDQGEISDFSENLCEMYFTMLFNKNQDDPTHASMQILDKMLEGEHKKNEIKLENKHLGYDPAMSDIDYAKRLINDGRTHQFSKKAIEVGSILFHLRNGADLHSQFFQSSTKPNVNKTLDEYATFKSSANIDRYFYDDTSVRQNTRRRCLEGVQELIKEGCMNSFDVCHKFKHDPTVFQVFKKNQIGGVREILILTMKKRIMINVLETVSRNLCSIDEREMLTHGNIKVNMIKSHIIECKKLKYPRFLMFYNFDKSRWGPTFMPIQFLYLFSRFKDQAPKMFNYITAILIQHQNKKCLFPEKLISTWAKDPLNKLQHRFNESLQQEKEKFLSTGKLYFENESNMGQGILHYTSSLLHMAMISFRDELYKISCQKIGLDIEQDHFDLVSSDDSFTVQALRIKNIKIAKFRISLFLRCQEVSEFLFNCRTSKSKSSISAIIGEFNSVFFSNMTTFPTVFKFAMAAVHPPSTDSFYRMVKESYISSRQIIENGGTLELYNIAQLMNKRFAEGIYHTYEGGVNHVSNKDIPYHIGLYPIFEPSLMVAFGPEFHNYMLYKRFHQLSSDLKKIFMASHKMTNSELTETLSDIETDNISLGGLLRIEAHVRPISLLKRMKDNSNITKEMLDDKIINNPIFVIEDPSSIEDVAYKTTMKLYQTSASEALKNNPSSIYYGRMSATVSANAFSIPNIEMKLTTYRNCLDMLIKENTDYDLDKAIKFIYPRYEEYEIFRDYSSILVTERNRDLKEIQNIHTLEFSRIYTRMTYSIKDVLKYYWYGKKPEKFFESKIDRDWSILESHFPMIKPTMEQTIDQFSGSQEQKIKSFVSLLFKIYTLKDRTIKAITYGENTRDIRESIEVLQARNMYSGLILTAESKGKIYHPKHINYDRIYWLHNYAILASLANIDWFPIIYNEPTNFDVFLMDPSISMTTKKRLLILLASANRITNYEEWTERTDTTLHYWDKPQLYVEGKWQGDFILTIFQGYKTLRIKSHNKRLQLFINTFIEPEKLMQMINHFLDLVGIKVDEMMRLVDIGDYIMKDNKCFQISTQIGFKIIKTEIPKEDLNYFSKIEVNDEYTILCDELGNKLMRVKTGLLPTVYHDKIKDFKIFNMMFSQISELRAFSSNFNVLNKDPSELLMKLDNLEVDQPKVTEITMKRLKLISTDDQKWEIREEKIEEEQDVTIIDKTTEFSYSDDLLDFNEEDLAPILEVDDQEYVEDFVITFNQEGIFTSFEIASEIIRTRQIFNNVKNLKYSLICSQCLDRMKVNSTVINFARRTYNNDFITWSLIFLYDRTYTTMESNSRERMNLTTNDEFIDKFSLLN